MDRTLLASPETIDFYTPSPQPANKQVFFPDNVSDYKSGEYNTPKFHMISSVYENISNQGSSSETFITYDIKNISNYIKIERFKPKEEYPDLLGLNYNLDPNASLIVLFSLESVVYLENNIGHVRPFFKSVCQDILDSKAKIGIFSKKLKTPKLKKYQAVLKSEVPFLKKPIYVGQEYYKAIGDVMKVNQHNNALVQEELSSSGSQLDQNILQELVLPPNVFLKKRKLIIDHDPATLNCLKGMCVPASEYTGKDQQELFYLKCYLK